MGKTLWKSQNMSLDGFFLGKHHPAPAVHLVRVAPGDEWKTAFQTRYGSFE